MRTRWLLVIFVGMTTLLVALIAVKLDNVQHKAMALKKAADGKALVLSIISGSNERELSVNHHCGPVSRLTSPVRRTTMRKRLTPRRISRIWWRCPA